jgi:hypothetical protein
MEEKVLLTEAHFGVWGGEEGNMADEARNASKTQEMALL